VDEIGRLKASEAAALLNVSPNTLRAWERRFGFPQPQRSQGRHRLYTHGDLTALRDALQEGLSISSAVSRAREGLVAYADSLVGALIAFDHERAALVFEATLALRSVERSVVEVLLPSLDEIVRTRGRDSAAWAFAARWGTSWLHRLTRLTPPPVRPASIMLGDASRGELDPDAPHIRALELLCVRASIKVLTLSVRGIEGIGDPIARHEPNLVVLAGSHVDNDPVARWAYAIRLAMGRFPVAVYRRGEAQATRVPVLPREALEATRRLMELLNCQEMRQLGSSSRTERRATASAPVLRAASL